MPRRLRIRDRLFWTHGEFCRWPHSYGTPWGSPPWWVERLTEEEEKEYLEGHVAMLKEELKAAEEELKEISEKQ